MRSGGEPGNTFWTGEFVPKWEQASTTVSDGVRYVSVPIAPHYYYVVQWDTDDGPVEVAAFQRLVVAKNLTTGARECYVATFVPRSSYSRWGANPATRFSFGNAGGYHGLLFTATLDGRPLNFMAFDRGKRLFDTSTDGNGVVAPMMRKAFGASTGLTVSYFWLVRTRADDECGTCRGSNDYCSLLDCGHWTCDGCTPVNDTGATWNDMMETPGIGQFFDNTVNDPDNEHFSRYSGSDMDRYASGSNGFNVSGQLGGHASIHSHNVNSTPSINDVMFTGQSAGNDPNYSASYIYNPKGDTNYFAIVVNDPQKAAQFQATYGSEIDWQGNFQPGSSIGQSFNSYTNGLSPYDSDSRQYMGAMGNFLNAHDSGMSVMIIRIDENRRFAGGESYGHTCSKGGK